MKPLASLEGKFALLCVGAVVLSISLCGLLFYWFDSLLFSLVLAGLIAIPALLYAVHKFMHPIHIMLTALGDGVSSFKDGDFSISLTATRRDELGELARQYNQVGDILRQERYNLYQRELLLDSVIQNTPWALLLVNTGGRVIYSNIAARKLFNAGRKLEGYAFDTLLENVSQTMRDAVKGNSDGMFSIRGDEEDEIYYVSREIFTLNKQQQYLYIFKQMTRELNRQEVAVWKKVIRVVSHELNNSLAPISSLAHSGQILAEQPDPVRLRQVFETIEERASHLNRFIEGYARFAKLPIPKLEEVNWGNFVASLSALTDFAIQEAIPDTTAFFDPVQMQQVLINLLKNAHESGSPAAAVSLRVRQNNEGIYVEVSDAGSGMQPEILEQALLPFYSTKQSGSGLGLPLCREIVEAHGGRLSLSNRASGGLTASIWLPLRSQEHPVLPA